jgi:hypothetical protein
MKSTGFTTLAYYITAGGTQGYTGNDANVVARINRNSTIQSYVTGAEPNATAYVYHKQANGIVSNVPAGTTPAAAFAAKLLPRSADSQGRVNFWAAGSETWAWDVGTSQVFAWIPIGMLDDGTQQYFAGATDGNLYRMETFPNLTATASNLSPQFPNTAVQATWPKNTYKITGGIQNELVTLAPTTVRWDEQPSTPNGNWLTARMDYIGTFTLPADNGAPEPGVWTVVFEQTYKGVAYRSNSITITSTSAEYYAWGAGIWPPTITAEQASLLDDRISWLPYSPSTPVSVGVIFKWYRTVYLTPNKTYTIKGWADNNGGVAVNYNFLTGAASLSFAFNLNGVVTNTFTTTSSGKTRLIFSLENIAGGPTFAENPAWISIQIWDGNTKVWGTAQATAAGY